MIMFHIPTVQLQDQVTSDDKTFVVRAAVRALAIEQSLIPTTADFNIAHANKWLWTHKGSAS